MVSRIAMQKKQFNISHLFAQIWIDIDDIQEISLVCR